MNSRQEAWDQLAFYTLKKRDAEFIHQHIVDAFAAQEADEATKPIKLVFALVGLYLHIERGFTGREVQKVHMQLAKRRKDWPQVRLPVERGALTVEDVAQIPPGPDLDAAIEDWCRVVWAAYAGSRELIAGLLLTELGIR
jgi:ribosomal protein L4